ncbi:MAG: hypothetical protein FWD73_17375 [Polyangiaceae bacterium]|nr:hypothetical protein [Polyangiaceae bacterium]
MTPRNMTLWQIIDALAQQIPFSKQKVETVLSTHLAEKDRNTYTIFLEGPGPELQEGVQIRLVDLRLARGAEGITKGFLVLDIGGTCITTSQLMVKYDYLRITDTPSGHSLNGTTAYSQDMSWGKLSFGFEEKNPDCLADVAFDPKKDD